MGEIKNMKKKYIKPTVMFEKIVFDTAIAACTFVEGNWVGLNENSQTCESRYVLLRIMRYMFWRIRLFVTTVRSIVITFRKEGLPSVCKDLDVTDRSFSL